MNVDGSVSDQTQCPTATSTVESPYADTYKLYILHTMYAFASRMWQFSVVLFMALLTNNSLAFNALAGLSSSIIVMLVSPRIGAALDHTNRMTSVKIALMAKVFFVVGKSPNILFSY